MRLGLSALVKGGPQRPYSPNRVDVGPPKVAVSSRLPWGERYPKYRPPQRPCDQRGGQDTELGGVHLWAFPEGQVGDVETYCEGDSPTSRPVDVAADPSWRFRRTVTTSSTMASAVSMLWAARTFSSALATGHVRKVCSSATLEEPDVEVAPEWRLRVCVLFAAPVQAAGFRRILQPRNRTPYNHTPALSRCAGRPSTTAMLRWRFSKARTQPRPGTRKCTYLQ